ncbi:hypothetical protein SANTM175S_05535 [Streptomyces antimycoticus]
MNSLAQGGLPGGRRRGRRPGSPTPRSAAVNGQVAARLRPEPAGGVKTTAAYRTRRARCGPARPPLLRPGRAARPANRPPPCPDCRGPAGPRPVCTAGLATLAAYARVCGFPVGHRPAAPDVSARPGVSARHAADEQRAPSRCRCSASSTPPSTSPRTGPAAARRNRYELAVHVSRVWPRTAGAPKPPIDDRGCASGGEPRVGVHAAPTWPRHGTPGGTRAPPRRRPGRRRRSARPAPSGRLPGDLGRRYAAVVRGPQPHPPPPAHRPPLRLPPRHRARHVDRRPVPRKVTSRSEDAAVGGAVVRKSQAAGVEGQCRRTAGAGGGRGRGRLDGGSGGEPGVEDDRAGRKCLRTAWSCTLPREEWW